MTSKVILRCDECGRYQEINHQGDADRWMQLTPYLDTAGEPPAKPIDLCPRCVAVLRGWKNGHGAGLVLERHT